MAEHEAPDDLSGHRDVAHARGVPRARRLRDAREGAHADDAEEVTKEVTASGIQGRGGAAFPMGRKWGVDQPERRPAALPVRERRRGRAGHLQGSLDPRERAAPAARVDADRRLRAAGAQRVRLHPRRVRPAVPPARRRRSRRPTRPATSASGILGTDFACDLGRSIAAPGSYVCGEASALITSIEGKRGYPRNRPPRLTVRGLYQKPTVVNNVETLSNIAWIVANGARGVQARSARAKNPGTRLISISGHINRPGVYEIEIGYPWAQVHLRGLRRHHGRPRAQGHHPRRHLDQGAHRRPRSRRSRSTTSRSRPPARRWARAAWSSIAEGTCMVRLLQVMLRFYHHESCGQCTPCREGMGWLHRIIDRIVAGAGPARGHRPPATRSRA